MFAIKEDLFLINWVKSPSGSGGVSQVLPQETRNSAPSPIQLKTDQLSQTFVTINNMKFADTETKPVIFAAISIKKI
jgi:hypothetical protein